MFIAICFLFVLAWAAYTDWQRRIIPNYVSAAVLLIGVYLNFTNHTWLLGFAGLTVAGITLIPYLLGSMGAGDVKLFLSLGFSMGPTVLVLIFFALVVLAFYLTCSWIVKHNMIIHVPLAPFMLAGYLIMGGVALVFKVIY